MKNTRFETILEAFPKTHPPLPQAYKDVYEQEYLDNRQGGNTAASLAQKLESWMHKQIAKGADGSDTLEMGAGTLNQLQYESQGYAYDIVEPASFFYEGKPALTRVRDVFDDLRNIPGDRKYGRVISIAVLEHLQNLPFEIARAALLLQEGGKFQAAIPCEGELAWYLGWRLGTGIPYWFRNKLDYGVLMRHEHINTSDEIRICLNHMFAKVTMRRFPLPFRHGSFYMVLEATEPDLERCRNLVVEQEKSAQTT